MGRIHHHVATPLPCRRALSPRIDDFGSRQDGLDDVVIAGATTKVAFHLFTHDRFGQRLGMGGDEIDRRHDHSGRTKSALQAHDIVKCLLHRMQDAVPRQPLDGGDMAALRLRRQHRAGFDRGSVQVDDTAAALRGVAADMRSR